MEALSTVWLDEISLLDSDSAVSLRNTDWPSGSGGRDSRDLADSRREPAGCLVFITTGLVV
jgi:hypothetical protein